MLDEMMQLVATEAIGRMNSVPRALTIIGYVGALVVSGDVLKLEKATRKMIDKEDGKEKESLEKVLMYENVLEIISGLQKLRIQFNKVKETEIGFIVGDNGELEGSRRGKPDETKEVEKNKEIEKLMGVL